MAFQFRPAVREDTLALIALYSRSGCGKTFSALLLARGIVGSKGKIAMIDTESGRGSLYSDQIPGGYDTLKLPEPFSPSRYIEAIQSAEEVGYDIAVIDSASHEWEGIGGVCDMASDIEERTKKKGLHCWNKPKQEHNKFVLKLLGSKIPLIVCIRAKFKSRQVGKSVVRDDFVSPIQSEDFIFEMTTHAEVMPDHSIRLTKCSHPELRTCFEEGKPITIGTGERIAAWSKGGDTLKPIIEILTDARVAASKGKQSLQDWWKERSQSERTHANTIIEELKETARQFDNPTSMDDPFEGDALPLTIKGFGQLTEDLSKIEDLSELAEFDHKYTARLDATPDSDMKQALVDQYQTKLTKLQEFS